MVDALTHRGASVCRFGSALRRSTTWSPPKMYNAAYVFGCWCVAAPLPALAQTPEHAAPELPNPDVPTAMELEVTPETNPSEVTTNATDSDQATGAVASEPHATALGASERTTDPVTTEPATTDPSTAKPGTTHVDETAQDTVPAEPGADAEESVSATARARPSSLSLSGKPSASSQRMFGTFEGTYGLGGVSVGTTFAPGGFVLGGELSLVRQTQEFYWVGGYVDATYDFARKQTRISVGPELGWSALGLDVGYLVVLDGETTRSGVTARPLVSIGYVTAYGRVSHLFDDRTWLEAGLLLKYPIEF